MIQDKYSANVFWSEEDNCFISTCTEFPMLSAHGESKEEALTEFQNVLNLAIESYQENGIVLPEPEKSVIYSGQLRIRLPKSLHKKLAEAANKEHISLNTYIVSLLSEKYSSQSLFSKHMSTLQYLIKSISPIILEQQNELLVHTERLNLIESRIPSSDTQQEEIGNFFQYRNRQTYLQETITAS